LTTLRRDQVRVAGDTLRFDYVAKEHQHRITEVADAGGARVVTALLALPGAAEDPLFRDAHDVGRPAISGVAVNAYLHTLAGVPATAKGFRTWSGTVVAAAPLAGAELPDSPFSGRGGPAALAVRTAALLLGNTPAVARAAYVHPAVLANGPDPFVEDAVGACAAREGHRDVRCVWTDPAVQAAVAARLAQSSPQH
jgi:DNA topoisomerase-1